MLQLAGFLGGISLWEKKIVGTECLCCHRVSINELVLKERIAVMAHDTVVQQAPVKTLIM